MIMHGVCLVHCAAVEGVSYAAGEQKPGPHTNLLNLYPLTLLHTFSLRRRRDTQAASHGDNK